MDQVKLKKNSCFLFVCFVAMVGCAFNDVQSVARRHLGVPYLNDPLGEGEHGVVDADPLYRTDAFDCLTYVETVLAQKHIKNHDDVVSFLTKIRYGQDVPDFFARRHFTSAQWIPNAEKMGLIAPLSFPNIETAYTTDISFPVWCRERVQDVTLKEKCDEVLFKQKTLSYVPREFITNDFVKQLPDDVVVFFVRCDASGHFVKGPMIAHTGFLFHGQQLVHASQTHNQVIAEPFVAYLLGRSKFCGVVFYKVD